MRVSKLSYLAVAVALLGCERSAVNPTDAIAVQGTLQDSSGAPRANAAVKLHRGPPRLDGSDCPLLLGTAWKTATTGADGTYKFEFTGKDSQTDDLLGTSEGGDLARCFRLVSEAPNEAEASTDFTVQVVKVEAPTLRDYEASLAVGGVAGTADFSWTAPAAGAKPTGYGLALTTENGESLWSVSSSGSTTTASVADYLFEGVASRAQVTARSEERTSGTIWPITVKSTLLNVAARGAAPLSRGGTCDLSTTPCPLTDGKFTYNSLERESVTITFSAPLAVKHVVLRGLSATQTDRVLIESSTDGTTFSSLIDASYKSGHTDHEAATAQAGVKALRIKAVKTSTSSGTPKLSTISEVSVFP